MTIKQFLEKQTLTSSAKLRFQFTDQQGINWRSEAPASRFEGELIENFPCDLKRKENNLFTFNLDLNEIPEGLFTTFSEIYEQAAKKSDEENITVQEYLQELEKGSDEGTNPKVFFYQKILIKDSNGRENIYSFATQNAVSLKEAVNSPLSHLFVDNVDAKDDTVFVNLVTTAEEITMRIQQEEQQQKAQQEEAVGYIDRMISEQEDYKVYVLGHRSDDEELLSEVEVELESLHMAKKALEESTYIREQNSRLSQQITNLQTQLARKEIVIQGLNEQIYNFLDEINCLLAEVDRLSDENEKLQHRIEELEEEEKNECR